MKSEKKLMLFVLTAGFILGSIAFIQDVTLTGMTVEETNYEPVWNGPEQFVIQKQLRLKLDKFFIDPDGDVLRYEATSTAELTIEIRDNELIIEAKKGFDEGIISVFASDGIHITRENIKII